MPFAERRTLANTQLIKCILMNGHNDGMCIQTNSDLAS